MPPQRQDVVEARRLLESVFHRARNREQLRPLIAQQAGSISARANEQGQFDQQLRADITRMSGRGGEPDPRGRAPRSRCLGQRFATLDHGRQATGLSDDQRGVHMVIAKEPPRIPTVAAKGSRFG